MMGDPTGHYDPKQHRVIEPNDFVRHVRAEFGVEDVDVLFNVNTKNWVLVEWLDRRYGKMQELLILGATPVGTRDMVRSLQSMVKAGYLYERTRGSNRKKLLGYKKECDRQDEDDLGEMQYAQEKLHRKPGHRETHRKRRDSARAFAGGV